MSAAAFPVNATSGGSSSDSAREAQSIAILQGSGDGAVVLRRGNEKAVALPKQCLELLRALREAARIFDVLIVQRQRELTEVDNGDLCPGLARGIGGKRHELLVQ
jgi:hypothetical protein